MVRRVRTGKAQLEYHESLPGPWSMHNERSVVKALTSESRLEWASLYAMSSQLMSRCSKHSVLRKRERSGACIGAPEAPQSRYNRKDWRERNLEIGDGVAGEWKLEYASET